jgi:soluble lytic murein transglycosylase-like protein
MIATMILMLAVEIGGVPPNFVLALAYTENSTLDPLAINRNRNGTYDRGVMQLNSGVFPHVQWDDPEENIRASIYHIKWLMERPGINTWWSVAVAYNSGYTRFMNGFPHTPETSLTHGDRTMAKWLELDKRGFHELIHRR